MRQDIEFVSAGPTLRGWLYTPDDASSGGHVLVVAQHDILTHSDLAFAAYERALHPKQLVTLPGGHFVVCNREFKTVLAHMTEFFLRHLGPRPAA
ncbi:hypothetical protein [Actinomadura hallensis]|uniref:hypothetical protein n=1 Tax=Actinomadura hallensis TaxID=337895 RepID=UPI00114D8FB7|nr:hypothetical protein [Actinomadura hallensis]